MMADRTSEWSVAVDVRCLQAAECAEVGRHGLALLCGVPDGVRLIGIADPAMPPLPDEARRPLRQLYPNAYAAEARSRSAGKVLSAFVALSPTTQDPLFTARITRSAALFKVAVLAEPLPRSAAALTWLARYDLIAATSAAFAPPTGASEQALLLTGEALDPPRAAEVSKRFWDGVLHGIEQRLAQPAISRGRRPRVAMLSPLPPERSGVADYTAATCAEFGKLVELDCFSDASVGPPPPGVRQVLPLTALPHLRTRYDRVVSVVGNSKYHLSIFHWLRRYGGACIAHDARMIGFYRYLLGVEHTLATASRELGRRVELPELDRWTVDEATMETLFLSEIAESATPSIVHSPAIAEAFKTRYGVGAAYIPFSIYRPWSAAQLTPAARSLARSRLGIAPGEIAIAAFGFVQEVKAPGDCLRAVHLLRSWGFQARLHFVGATYWLEDKGAGLRRLIDELGLQGQVRLDDSFVPEQVYRDYLVGSDLGVQLRTYGFGSLSGGLLDCAAAGLPTVANASLADALGAPASYVRRIPDAITPHLLAHALAELLDTGRIDREADRLAFSDQHSFERYAQSLCRMLEM